MIKHNLMSYYITYYDAICVVLRHFMGPHNMFHYIDVYYDTLRVLKTYYNAFTYDTYIISPNKLKVPKRYILGHLLASYKTKFVVVHYFMYLTLYLMFQEISVSVGMHGKEGSIWSREAYSGKDLFNLGIYFGTCICT